MLKGDGHSQGYHYKELHWILATWLPIALIAITWLKPRLKLWMFSPCSSWAFTAVRWQMQSSRRDCRIYTSARAWPRICTAAAASVTHWVRKGKAGEGKRGEWEKVKESVFNPSTVDVLIAACTRYSHHWPNPISPPLPLAKNKLALLGNALTAPPTPNCAPNLNGKPSRSWRF